MNVLKTAPVIEPNTLAELKLHLKLDSETFAGVNMVYLDELLNADHDRPMYFLRRFDDSIKTKNSDTIKEKDKT